MVGETATLRVPASADSRVLITLESGSKVISAFWEQAKAGENTFSFKTTPEMAPTVYAHVSLIQPHNQLNNDLPIRMYGVTPISVEDPKTRIQPAIAMPKTLEPEQTFTVEVSEEKGQPMAYTVAIVDEGLLDLTNFKTPNPWDVFYAREALGVKTFDVYDYVLGAYGGSLERLFSIGGDGVDITPPVEKGAQRFKPVVIHAGPFYLEKGKKAKHEFKMPNYVGSVRAMVVAADKGAYGHAEQTVAVKKPLMLLATLPRVLSPGETLRLPVNVFAMEDGIGSVTVSVEESSGIMKWGGAKSQNVSFAKMGEKMAYFDVTVGERVGKAKFVIKAKNGKHSASHEIEIQVRNPNPYVAKVEQAVIEAGKDWNLAYEPLGMAGTNSVVLEVSSMPPLNLQNHLKYLLQYPYGCLEQTLSSGFPQLYVDRLLNLTEEQKKETAKNVQATVDKLRNFLTAEGAFSYWPGQSHINMWSDTYAGHFLLEAQKLGYNIPAGMIDRWKARQKQQAKLWDPKQNREGFYASHSNELAQAYRLYALALAKDPEMGAMNRLREQANLHPTAKWRLAAAYALAGQKEAAAKLLEGVGTDVPDYRELSGSFGSSLRDKAMILETLVQLGRKEDAAKLVRVLSDEVSRSAWYSTQEIGYTLIGIGKYVAAYPPASALKFQYQLGSQAATDAGADSPIMQVSLSAESGALKVKNTSNGILYARLISSGQPLIGKESSASENIRMEVSYKTVGGAPLDVSKIKQGMDFIAEVAVTHPNYPFSFTYHEMALDQVFPSGWEIINTRMDELEYFNNTSRPEYLDIRDDRVYTFFDLPPGKTQIYRVRLNAAYLGRFYLPAVSVQAMYDDQIHAHQAGKWIEVVL
jgi:alpha-2-macroglobulin